jgi:hypothetical protein
MVDADAGDLRLEDGLRDGRVAAVAVVRVAGLRAGVRGAAHASARAENRSEGVRDWVVR